MLIVFTFVMTLKFSNTNEIEMLNQIIFLQYLICENLWLICHMQCQNVHTKKQQKTGGWKFEIFKSLSKFLKKIGSGKLQEYITRLNMEELGLSL